MEKVKDLLEDVEHEQVDMCEAQITFLMDCLPSIQHNYLDLYKLDPEMAAQSKSTFMTFLKGDPRHETPKSDLFTLVMASMNAL